MPAKKPELVPLSSEQLAEMEPDEKHLEAWHLSITGHSQREIGKRFGVGPSQIGRWLDEVGIERRTRSENIERETERIIGLLEAVAVDSYRRAEAVASTNPASMVGPSHMKNVLDSVKEIARLRGIEPTTKGSGGSSIRTTEVIVRIGGRPGDPPVEFVDVGVRETMGQSSPGPGELVATA